jgi:hypothetical protein
MKILVTLQTTEGTKPEDLRTHIVEENKAVWELYKTDVIREMYFRGDGREAIFVVESVNENAEEETFSQLLMVRDELLEAEFILLKPFTQIESAFVK